MKKKIRVCQVCAVDFTFKHFLVNLIKHQKEIGWEITCVSSRGKYLKELNKMGFNIKRINISRNFNILKHIISLIEIYKYFKKQKFDIIHTHTPLVSIIVRLACIFINETKVVYTAHGFYFHENMNIFLYNFFLYLEKFLANFTNLIFVQSKEDYNLSIKKIASKKTFYIGNGIDLKRFNLKNINLSKTNKIKRKLKIKPNTMVVGMVCRLVHEKGIKEFLEASLKFSKKNKNFLSIIIGERLKNEHSKSVKMLIEKYKRDMKNQLIILGKVEDVENYLAVFSVFCLPSYREGLPRSIIEAMSLKLPVITTNIRGCRELIKDKVNGFIVPIKNSELINFRINTLYNSKKLRDKMGEKNLKKVIKFYNEKNIINKQLNHIYKLLNEKNTSYN